jgi:23S rRNA pseudouridine2605 synthase
MPRKPSRNPAAVPPVSLPRALSKLGLCSRGEGLRRIQEGRVSVNGQRTLDPSKRVDLDRDEISIDGNAIDSKRAPIVLALHKPAGYVTTRSDPQGRPTVYDLLPSIDRFVFPVGRLDLDTSGLLLFTDDHRLGEALTNPESHIDKTYLATLDQSPDEAGLASLRRGLDIGRGEKTRPALVTMKPVSGGAPRAELRIVEGRNRQVRRMFAAIGVKVTALERTAIGKLGLGGLRSGDIRRLEASEIALLRATPGACVQRGRGV